MNTRDNQLLTLRPTLPSAKVNDNMSDGERFQNTTLRPIAKLQNDILIEVFKNYIFKHKNVFYDLTISKRMDYVEYAIQRDIKFRNSLKGIIIGQFTLVEYKIYVEDSSALNKRMMNIVKERLQSQLQILDGGPSFI